MKNLFLRQRRGFTLVELLIVIAIIMVLASLGFAGVQVGLRKAKTVQSLNLANNLSQAIQNFYDEYGTLPSSTVTAAPFDTASTGGVNVLRVLLAQETGATVLNTRGITFLNAKTAKGGKSGIDYGSGSTANAMYDAWGEPFYVVFDHDYNDEIPNPIIVGSPEPAIVRGVKAVIYSKGADRTANTKDDVKNF